MASYKILVVDDNQEFREMMRFLLEMWGYDVDEAQEGQTGLRILAQKMPDLILLDYHMPQMNGIEMAKAVRQISPDIPVIFITANFDISFLRPYNNMQTLIMQKPFNIDMLQSNITSLLH
jgi:CheY-like chemotaxis protein